ncbi:MAG TPA: hypothetical protein PLZ20_15760, partial [Nitrospira sp.]|nr:hypothetical protein [Nitrospira sp.]
MSSPRNTYEHSGLTHHHEKGPSTMNAILFLATVMFAIQAAPLVHAEPPTGALVGRVLYVGQAIPDQVIEVIRDSAFCGTQATIKSVAVHVK